MIHWSGGGESEDVSDRPNTRGGRCEFRMHVIRCPQPATAAVGDGCGGWRRVCELHRAEIEAKQAERRRRRWRK